MKARWFAPFVLAAVLGLGVTFALTTSGTAQNWAQVNSNGFGDPANRAIFALAPFDGQLYAGTFNSNGAQLWRRAGTSWSPVITNGFGITRNVGVDHLSPFNGQLYASTYNDVDGGEIWRSSNGLDWTRVVSQGFGDPAVNGEIFRFAVLSNTLYAGTWSYTDTRGAQIWQTLDGLGWTNTVTNGFGDANNYAIFSFEVFNGYLYAGTGSSTAGELWRSDGTSWNPVETNGFGNVSNRGISSLAEFHGYLYAGTRNSSQGGELWRSSNGLEWTAVFTGGLGNVANGRLYGLIVFDSRLHLVFSNLTTGAEVWRSADGSTWERVVEAGWGDSNNQLADYFDKGAAVFDNGLYIGTYNTATGGEIWLYKSQIATLYVAPGGNCGGVAPCYATVQGAVDAASDLDWIKVASGTYTDAHVRPRNDVTTTGVVTQVVYVSVTLTIEGGYTTTNWITPDPAANPTTLDAQGQGRVIYITGDINPWIEGLHITGGDATGMGGEATNPTDSGGGVYVWRALATLRRNWVFSNTAETGGGVFVGDSRFTQDKPGATIAGNTIFSNTADSGGGLALSLSTAGVSDNLVRGNDANNVGGGLHLLFSHPTIQRNMISANSAGNGGGGYFQWSGPLLANNVIADNHIRGGRGSGLHIQGGGPHMFHNTIARNTSGDGSGVYVVDLLDWGQPTMFMTNTILVNQPIGISASGISTVTVNGILWYDTPITVSKSVTAVVTVNNQFTGNPLFAPDGYHLSLNSAAIDKGVNAGVTEDIDGESRPSGLGYDLGADEFWPKMIYLPVVLR